MLPLLSVRWKVCAVSAGLSGQCQDRLIQQKVLGLINFCCKVVTAAAIGVQDVAAEGEAVALDFSELSLEPGLALQVNWIGGPTIGLAPYMAAEFATGGGSNGGGGDGGGGDGGGGAGQVDACEPNPIKRLLRTRRCVEWNTFAAV